MRGFFYFIMSQIKKLKTSITTDETNIETLQGKMTTAESNIETLQGKMTTAESNISTLQEKNYICVGLSANTNLTTSSRYGNEIIPLDTIRIQEGNSFELDTGKIKVKKDCTVKISANSSNIAPSGHIISISIKLNNGVKSEVYDYRSDNNWGAISLSPLIISVTSGDEITLNYGSDSANTTVTIASQNYTYLTIEELK